MRPLPFTKDQMERIVRNYPTPFHIYDAEGIRENVRKLQKAFAWNPGFREYFAVKALPNPIIMKLLHEEGCGMDCSSLTELMLSRAVGITGHDIMFSSNDTPAEEFELASEMGVLINLDDITHIDFLKAHGGIPKTICCRFNPGGEFMLGNTIMGNPGDAKYGFTREQIFEGFRRLMDEGAENFGLHAFLASNTTDDNYYPTLARQLFRLAVELKETLGANVTFINLSGGVGIPYRPYEKETDIAFIGSEVERVYQEVVRAAGMEISIFTELGRYITGPYGYLVTRAIHEKNTYKKYIGLDACACNLMRPAMYGAYHHITVLGKENAPLTQLYDVIGSLCENNDKFAVDRPLPKIDIGDLVVIHDTGAHGFSMGYNYNGKLRSAELLLEKDGSVQMIRRAETPEDYFRTLDFLHLF
ncbi:MAG: diaminopimelate decarboxylase [Christensenellales bacterium]|jgi:diaminopimelate decarboxylase|nr:diaminopimelate decarboxylase [Clostridium sp.]MDD7139470.1 diaminopimelate decarboxylase [Clostridium sp.]